MAITIQQSPNTLTVKGQKLIFTASSDNTAEPNFKYVVVVKDESANEIAKFYISPNPLGVLHFDLRRVVEEDVKIDVTDNFTTDEIIHNIVTPISVAPNGCKYYEVEIGEYYGDPVAEYLDLDSDFVYLNDGYLQPRDGYRNPLTEYQSSFTGKPKTWLVNREVETYPIAFDEGVVIKTNDNEYGTVAWWYSSIGIIGDYTPVLRYQIYDSDGIIDTQFINYSGGFGGPAFGSTAAQDQQLYGGFYPANLNDGGVFTELPSGNPDWVYYTLTLFDETGLIQSSLPLFFVNTCPSSKHTDVQLAWRNTLGGWEYMTFNGRRKDEVKSKSKNYTRILGTYADSTFTFNDFDRQDTPFHVDSALSYTLYRQQATDVDTRLMASLSKSTNVMINLEGGEYPQWLPVVLERANFEMQPTKSSKNQTITVKVKLAQTENA